MADGIELATAWFRLVPTLEGSTGELTKGFTGAEPDIEKAGEQAGSKWSKKATLAAVAGVAALSATVVGIFNTGMDELKFGEQINAQTQQLIDNTGFEATVEQINDYTLSLSKMSGVSEEELQAAGNNLLKFGGLSATAYQEAVASINDIAATGKDAASVSEGLGKALADPATAAGVLRRQGIALSESQQQLIDQFIEAGDKAGAQNVILAALEDTYGGMAEAAGGTLEGNLNKLNNAFENMAGDLVSLALPAVEGLIGGLQGLVGWLSENQGVVIAIAAVIGGTLVAAFIAWTASIWASTIALLANPVTWIILAILALIAAVVLLVMNWDQVVKWVTDIWAGFISWITGVIEGFVGWWNGIWSAVGRFLADLWQRWIVDPINRATLWIWNTVVTVMNTVKSIWEGAWAFIGGVVRNVWNSIIGWIERGVNGAIDLINGFTGGIRDVAGAVFGVEIGAIPHVRLPRLADGATVLPRPGGTAAILAEAGRPESVVDTGLMNRALKEGLSGTERDGPAVFNLFDVDGVLIGTIQGEVAAASRDRRVALAAGTRKG